MMRRFPYPLGLAMLAAILWLGCENDLESVRGLGYFKEIPTEIAYDVEMLYSDSGQVRVIVRTPQLQRFGGKDSREEFLGGLTVQFLGENLRPKSRLTARKAIKRQLTHKNEDGRNIRESAITVQDSVVLSSRNGNRMETEELTWFENSGRMSTDKWVHIQTPDKDIFGFGFESDKEFKNWTIRSVVGEVAADGLLD